MDSKAIMVVAAIDFGTTYSAWACSFISSPSQIIDRSWHSSTFFTKTPTAVLIDSTGSTLHKFGFGYEAEETYAKMASSQEKEHRKWYYFHNFKMLLYGQMNFDRNVNIKDKTGKRLPAKKVFSLAIRYLKDDVMRRLQRSNVQEDTISWILTVPAIWNDSVKQFMRETAVMAGISNERLTIALEPETAAIYCCNISKNMILEGHGPRLFNPGSRYVVVDAGGGTVDITIQEVVSGGKLKQLHKPSGGNWGGTQVDKAYKQFIISLVGENVYEQFKDDQTEYLLAIFRNFEITKKRFNPDEDTETCIEIPAQLIRMYKTLTGKDLCDAIQQKQYAEKVFLNDTKLHIDASIMSSFFSKPIESIVSHLQELIENNCFEGVSSILMVGGFSESIMLQNAIRLNFTNFHCLIPQFASLAVLHGAVLFGHNPASIVQRVCGYTYGIKVTAPFDKEKHDIIYRKEDENGQYCDNIFDKFVEEGEIVEINETSMEKSYIPRREDQTNIEFPIYATKQKTPMYVTDAGCIRIGCIKIDIQDKSVPRNQRSFIFSMKFGSTEIKIAAKEVRKTENNVEDRISLSFLE